MIPRKDKGESNWLSLLETTVRLLMHVTQNRWPVSRVSRLVLISFEISEGERTSRSELYYAQSPEYFLMNSYVSK
ncbi:hypothetical protein ACHAW5_002265 [Stephanodiscus triporus]|uniref:Uncharacterized protein n=1 Tax=Stephanodiscus triporus TaxID=2934178 RepID=A0ABD3MF56_9STRA